MKLDNLVVKRIRKDLLPSLIPLYKSAFKKDYTLSYLQKKFDTIRFGAEYIGYIAFYNEKAIACYVVFPCNMIYKGQTILAAQSGDTMTHPQHRGKGLFKLLAEKTFELAKNENVKFIFGFPNKESYHGFTKSLLWVHQENMNMYKINVPTLPIASICKKNKIFSFFYKGYLRILLSFYKKTSPPFTESTSQVGNISIPAYIGYMNYKTYGGSFIVNINNTNVWMKINNALLIGDIEQIKDEEGYQVIKRLKRFAFMAGCRQLVFSFSKGSFWDKELSKNISPEEGFPIAYLDLGVKLPLENLAFSFSALDTF
jgi:hypothetical protein